jgi:hypothetical protein
MAGGVGGGGKGGLSGDAGVNSIANSGGGGGGGGNNQSGGAGGSGIVIVKELDKASGAWNIHDQFDALLEGTWPKAQVGIDGATVIMVAAGGGGGADNGAGGGAGGVLVLQCVSLGFGSLPVTIGAGGRGSRTGPGNPQPAPLSPATVGGNTVLVTQAPSPQTFTANGGGAGGAPGRPCTVRNGGSGGGGSRGGESGGTATQTDHPAFPGSAFADPGGDGSPEFSGGGGGSQGAGADAPASAGGSGGSARDFSPFFTQSLPQSRLAGGGSAGNGPTNPLATDGGGGRGHPNPAPNEKGEAGDANTGGGGGGGGGNPPGRCGGEGGSGIIVVEYPGPARATGGSVNTACGTTRHVFTSSTNLVIPGF